MKKIQSEQAKRDSNRVSVIQDANSTVREKDGAFSELFTEHNKQLNVFFMHRTNRDENVSEELLMDTFRKVYEKIALFDKERNAFSTWLYKIATNNLIDHTRKATMEVFSLEKMVGKNTEESEGMEFQIASEDLNPVEEIANTALGKEIYDAIHELPNKLVRDVMIERYINELSFNEIEDKMGIERNCSSLRVNVGRGKKILSKKLSHLENYAR